VSIPSAAASKKPNEARTRAASADVSEGVTPRASVDERRDGGCHSIAQMTFLRRRCALSVQPGQKWLFDIQSRAGHLSGRAFCAPDR